MIFNDWRLVDYRLACKQNVNSKQYSFWPRRDYLLVAQ